MSTTFEPPVIQGYRTLPGDRSVFNRASRYLNINFQGQWVLKEAGVYSAVISPDLNRLAAAEKVYTGGHATPVTQAEADELVAAGFGGGLSTRLVDQTLGIAERERWLTFVRACGGLSPPDVTTRYVGGDIMDGVKRANGGVFWLGADIFTNPGGTVLDPDDTYAGFAAFAAIARNGFIFETPPGGVFTSQVYQSGTSGLWIDADAQGGFAGKLWWPLTIIEDPSGTMHVAALLVDPAPTTPGGTLLDSHLITLNVFGGFSSVTPCGFTNERFYVHAMRRDDTHTYIIGCQFVPDFDPPRGLQFPDFIGGSLENLRDHYLLPRMARVPSDQLTTIANWRFWDGSAWVPGVENAALITDDVGRPIHGGAGLRRVSDGLWLLCARTVADTHVHIYRASQPQGPWTRIAQIPVPDSGIVINGGVSSAWNIKFIEHLAAPPDHSIVMLSMVLNNMPLSLFPDANIRQFTPQFVVVPHS